MISEPPPTGWAILTPQKPTRATRGECQRLWAILTPEATRGRRRTEKARNPLTRRLTRQILYTILYKAVLYNDFNNLPFRKVLSSK